MSGRNAVRRFFTVLLGAALAIAPAIAGTDPVKRSMKTKGATTVSWNSSFENLEYDCSQVVLSEGDLAIVVETGDALFLTFTGKKKTFTPKGVDGSYSAGDVFAFTVEAMHYDAKRDVFIANVHLKARLEIDKDGLPGRETTADYGVNVHLERPGAWGNCN